MPEPRAAVERQSATAFSAAPLALLGWKQIAGGLGVSVRTAQRWARRRGLPVHYKAGRIQATPYAFPGELLQWLKGGDTPLRPARLDVAQLDRLQRFAQAVVTQANWLRELSRDTLLRARRQREAAGAWRDLQQRVAASAWPGKEHPTGGKNT